MPKRMQYNIISIGLLLLFTLSCHAMSRWQWEVRKVYIGTRSEGTTGVLYFSNKAVPPTLTELYTPIGYFQYIDREYLWSNNGGWRKTGSFTLITDEKPFLKKYQDDGFYYSKKRFKGTPNNWVFYPQMNLWLDPERQKPIFSMSFSNIKWAYSGCINAQEDFETDRNLSYSDNPIDKAYKHIITPLGEFRALKNNAPDRGWRFVSKVNSHDIEFDNSSSITKEQLKDGKVYGNKRIKGMPLDWCYLPEKRLWLSPSIATRKLGVD